MIAKLKDGGFTFKRSNSQTSITSAVNDETNEQFMRLCLDCIRLLNKKYEILKDRTTTPNICKLYDVIENNDSTEKNNTLKLLKGLL